MHHRQDGNSAGHAVASAQQPPPIDGQIRHLELPGRRLRRSFRLIAEVTDAATAAALLARFSSDQAAEVQFEISMLGRGLNALKAVRLLCQKGHWEFAVSAVRQLFELVLNLEEIDAASDRRAAMARYETFALLQELRREVETLEYGERSGRPVDEERLITGRRLLDDDVFTEFRERRRNGQTAWAISWSGKNAWEMAQASPAPLRRDQYHLLFAAWSEQVHAAPAAVLHHMFRSEDTVEEVIARDDIRIAETIASALTHFLELWSLLAIIPGPDLRTTERWYRRILSEAARVGSPG